MADAAPEAEALPDGFHLRGKPPQLVVDDTQKVLLASIPVLKSGDLYSKTHYDEDIHSLFSVPVSKTVGSKNVAERTCCLCLTTVVTTSNNSTMRNHFFSDAHWKSHMVHVDLRSWPKDLVDKVSSNWAEVESSAKEKVKTGASGGTGKRKADQVQISAVFTKTMDVLQVRRIITQAIVQGGLIVTLMENPGLRYLVQQLAFGGQNVPRGLSSRSIQRSIYALYQEKWGRAKEEIMEILLGQPGMKSKSEIDDYFAEFGGDVNDMDDPMVNTRRVNLIQDTWSGRNNLGFLGVLAQIMDTRDNKKWMLRNTPLACKLFRSPHTIDRCRTEIGDTLTEAGLSWYFVRTCVQDTTAASIGVCKMVPHVGRAPCFAHTTQLFLKHSAENSPKVLDILNACNVVSIAMNTPKRLQLLHDQQEKDKLKPRNTVSLCATRWNSVETQITALLAVLQPLSTVVATRLNDIYPDNGSGDDKKKDFTEAWNKLVGCGGLHVLRAIVVFLRLNTSWTHALCSKMLVTSSLVIPATMSIQAGIVTLQEDAKEFVKQAADFSRQSNVQGISNFTRNDLSRKAAACTAAAEALKEYAASALIQWDRYFGSHFTNQWYWLIPSLLDPRVLRNSLKQEQISSAIIAVKGWMALNSETDLDDGDAEDEDDRGDDTQQDHFAAFLGTQQQPQLVSLDEVRLSQFDTDMRLYTSMLQKAPGDIAAIDPLQFWAQHSKALPCLSRIAATALAIPATSGMAEQLFSTSGFLLSPRRCRLSPNMLNMLVFLYYYSRAEMARVGVPLRDKREEKRRKTGIDLAKMQLQQVRSKFMLVTGDVDTAEDDEEDDDDNDDNNAEGGRPPPDPQVLEALYDKDEEDDEYQRKRHAEDEQADHDAHVNEFIRVETEAVLHKQRLAGCTEATRIQEMLEQLLSESNTADQTRKFELRGLIAATKQRMTELTGKRARARRS